MNEPRIDRSKTPVKYTIKIDTIADMSGFVVEIIDKFNSTNYTLSGVYLKREIALKEADTFINNLFEEELSMFVN